MKLSKRSSFDPSALDAIHEIPPNSLQNFKRSTRYNSVSTLDTKSRSRYNSTWSLAPPQTLKSITTSSRSTPNLKLPPIPDAQIFKINKINGISTQQFSKRQLYSSQSAISLVTQKYNKSVASKLKSIGDAQAAQKKRRLQEYKVHTSRMVKDNESVKDILCRIKQQNNEGFGEINDIIHEHKEMWKQSRKASLSTIQTRVELHTTSKINNADLTEYKKGRQQRISKVDPMTELAVYKKLFISRNNRDDFNRKVMEIKKRKHKKNGGKSAIRRNIRNSKSRQSLHESKKEWRNSLKKLHEKVQENKEKCVEINERKTKLLRSKTIDNLKEAERKRVKSLDRKSFQYQSQKKWIALIFAMQRLRRLADLYENRAEIVDWMEKREKAALSIQTFYRERLKNKMRKSMSLQVARAKLAQQKARDAELVKKNAAADVVQHFVKLMYTVNPMQFEMKKKSQQYAMKVVKVQRWFRHILTEKRKQKLAVEKQWRRQEKLLKMYAERDGEYFHSIPKQVRKYKISRMVDRYRLEQGMKYIKYLREMKDIHRKRRHDIKWMLMKQSMGLPPNVEDYVEIWKLDPAKPIMTYSISDKDLKGIIHRVSKRQMVLDMQKLLGSDIVECV